jgi:L-proline amide hydrolase
MDWDGGWTWYRVEGDLGADGRMPLVILHGGPGAAHDYLEPVADLAGIAGRPCVLYDQIGCGRSQHRPDAPAEYWNVELFVRELAALVEHLGIAGGYHVLGQSWGGMLGMEYALGNPPGLRSLVVANSPASIELWISEANRLRGLLPLDVQDTLTRHEAAGTTDSDEYEQAVGTRRTASSASSSSYPVPAPPTLEAARQHRRASAVIKKALPVHALHQVRQRDLLRRSVFLGILLTLRRR